MRTLRTLALCALSVGASLALPGLALADDTILSTSSSMDGIAQDEEGSDDDDFLDDLLGETDGGGDSVKDEMDAVRSGDIGDTVGARNEEVILLADEKRERRVIKTIQRKNFMKIDRWELSPHVAFVANDPFLNRYIAGAGIARHITEVFAVELTADFSPDLAEGDWKPLTKQLVEENRVSPDISKLTYFGALTFQFSPIYGKVAVVGREIITFDIYGQFGMGMTRTADDLTALQAEGDPRAQSTQFQIHPTTNFGGGLRIGFSPNISARVEGRSMVYIETVNATTLEMKNNFILQAAISFFLPSMKR